MEEEKSKRFQQLRNILYAVSAVLGLSGIVMDETFINAIVAGIIALFGIITDVIAWWYSRQKFQIKDVSEPPVASQ